MAALLDTPSRVLRRVQQYEDMELPSLPSFQHDMDYESDDNQSQNDSVAARNEPEDFATPHVLRQVSPPRTESTIMPRARTPLVMPSPVSTQEELDTRDEPFSESQGAAYTSTPYSEQFNNTASFLKELSRSGSLIRDSDAAPRSEDWDNTSASFRLPPPSAAQEYTELPDLSLPQQSFSLDQSNEATRHALRDFSDSNGSAASNKTPPSVVGAGSRIPSLSRSEFSGTDNEATTPEGPGRLINVDSVDDNVDPTEHEFDTTSLSRATAAAMEEQIDAPSPAKSTIALSQETPHAIRYMDMPSTAARAAATPFPTTTALRDVTPNFRNRVMYTPSSANSPAMTDPTTPRAPLDDAERRKSHVLSVLASASLPTRTGKRGTPFPLRRASLVPETESIAEEASLGTVAVTSRVYGTDDTLQSAANESFISIASSQDLTMDRRGSRLHQRANTSVPNILLGASAAFPGLALNLDSRPDAIKIHKHLNMMNKQLLDTNSELAREAEDWRDQCAQLLLVLQEAGIELDDDGNVIGQRTKDSSLELPTLTASTASADRRQLRDDLRALERQLKDKDALVAQLNTRSTDDCDEVLVLRAKLEQSESAHAILQAEFAQKTDDHAQRFAEICTDFQEQVGGLESQLAAAKAEAARLRDERDTDSPRSDEEDTLREQLEVLRFDLNRAQDEARSTQSRLYEAEYEAKDAQQRCEGFKETEAGLREELAESRAQQTELQARLSSAEGDVEGLTAVQHAKTSATSALEDEVESLRVRIHDLQNALAAAQDEVGRKTRSLEEQQSQHISDEAAANRHIDYLRKELERAEKAVSDKEGDTAALQNQLEVAQIQKDVSVDDVVAPGDSSLVVALEDRLDAAYREIGRLKHEVTDSPARKSALEARDARIKTLETEKLALQERLKTKEIASPSRWGNTLTSTPLVHKTLASLKMPMTPGPLRETTIGDSNESILRAQLEHLQQELDIANSQLDRNFGRLEDAGLGALQLVEKLALANDHIAQLEEQLRNLARDNKQSQASLDLGRTTNERLEAALDAVREQMDSLKADMNAEKDRLRDDNRRLRVLLNDLQIKCEEELEAVGVEMVRVQRDARDKQADSEEQLRILRQDKDSLEAKLRVTRSTITRLEQDIARLQQANDAANRKDRRIRDQTSTITEQQETINSLQDSLRDARGEADELQGTHHQTLRALESAERRVSDLQAERVRITRELVEFGEDLNVQRQECAKFGHELDALREAQADDWASQLQNKAKVEDQLRWTRERLDKATRVIQDKERLCAELDAHVAEIASHKSSLNDQRQKFKVQTRRLSAQIDYLKAKYTREATFRNALALQKKFLLLLVGGMSLNEQATLRQIASMGYPVASPPRPKRTLKAVGLAVVALIRARRMAGEWKKTKETRAIGVARKTG